MLQECKIFHRDIIKQLDFRSLIVTLTLSMATSVLCMVHPLPTPYLSVNVNIDCLGIFQSNCRDVI